MTTQLSYKGEKTEEILSVSAFLLKSTFLKEELIREHLSLPLDYVPSISCCVDTREESLSPFLPVFHPLVVISYKTIVQ